jgi:hypothetical protein
MLPVTPAVAWKRTQQQIQLLRQRRQKKKKISNPQRDMLTSMLKFGRFIVTLMSVLVSSKSESSWGATALEADVAAGCPKQTVFVKDQFDNFLNSMDCQAFVDSFSDEFDWCDVVCFSNNKTLLMGYCEYFGSQAGKILDIRVLALGLDDPSIENPPDYCMDIAVVGQQENTDGGCFHFSIHEILEYVDDDEADGGRRIISKAWTGYNVLTEENCTSACNNDTCSSSSVMSVEQTALQTTALLVLGLVFTVIVS